MQFKYPELLWALLLLLIPILIHLFQLRRFKKTLFTNVAMLQMVVSESRKSSTLKKWLLLLTRLLLIAALVLAFAQPFFAKQTAFQEKEVVVYLDDSFSMQAKQNNLTLFEKGIQDLLTSIPRETNFSLFTNTKTFTTVQLKSVQNTMLNLKNGSKQLSLNEIILKANTLFSKEGKNEKNLVLVSDFQDRLGSLSDSIPNNIKLHLAPLQPDTQNNISIDSLYLGRSLENQTELHAVLSGALGERAIPVSVYNGNQLFAKTGIDEEATSPTTLTFSLPSNTNFKGTIVVDDQSLVYDNRFYFNLQKRDKINVLEISQSETDFLKRIFLEEEFNFSSYKLNTLDYSKLEEQQLIILNNLTTIPTGLQTVLINFHQNGGSISVIPALNANTSNYETFVNRMLPTSTWQLTNTEQPISSIAFEHPLFRNVFEKKVSNFDYPKVNNYFKIQTNGASALQYANGSPFLVSTKGFYVFTTSLESDNTNFKSSPLIVPTFYNMALFSLQPPKLYETIGENATIELKTSLAKNNIVKVTNKDEEFIPLQQSYTNKVSLSFLENPKKAGIYDVINEQDTLKHLSFNHSRAESTSGFLNLETLPVTSIQPSIKDLFRTLDKDKSISEYWKWLVIAALFFLLMELLIQKLIP